MEISRFSLLNVVLFKGQDLGGVKNGRALHAVLFLLGLLVSKELSLRGRPKLQACSQQGKAEFTTLPPNLSLSEGPTEDLELMDVSWTHTPSMTPWPFHNLLTNFIDTLPNPWPQIQILEYNNVCKSSSISISSSSSKLCKQYQSISYTYHIIILFLCFWTLNPASWILFCLFLFHVCASTHVLKPA